MNDQPAEKLIVSDGNVLDVHSVFPTIQGEGPFAGEPCLFVRLAGCNLQCPSCDTEYTAGRTTISVEDLVYDIKANPVVNNLIVITGGEPFRQNIYPLIRGLVINGFRVQIETNGSLFQHKLGKSILTHPSVTIICSPKAGKINKDLTRYIDAYKYVLSHDSIDPDDGLPTLALDHSAHPKVARPPEDFRGNIYLQPMDAQDDLINQKNLESVIDSCMTHGYTLGIQIHKIIGMD